ncbi:MAG TPA: hypothetical protein IAB11_03890 [Candidatus Ornithoclostridium faecavium]|nr:hypothetical protein [Candidatus Ornithoclostridium faecavium]
MKRKLLAIVIVVAVIASLTVGCSSGIFEIDGNRDYHQVVATVQYNQMSAPIYKGDVLVSYSQYAPIYMQYYGMSSEEVVEYLYQNLSRQKLVLLYAKDYLAKNDLGITDDAAIAKLSNEDFLTVDEIRYCIEKTNKTFEDSWQQLISDLEDEQAQNSGDSDEEEEETEEDEDLLEARPGREEEEESDEYVDQGLTDKNELPEKFVDYVNDKISSEEDKDAQKNMQSALNDLNKNLESSYKDYDYYLNSYYETRILEKYEEMLGDSLLEITDDEINTYYTKLKNTQISNYIDESAYSSALSSATNLIYHTTKGYSQVRSILLKFSEDQTAALENVQSLLEGNDTAIENYRALLALGSDVVSSEELGIYENLTDNGIKVNVSNPDYNADEDELKDAYTDLGVDYRVILYAMANDIAEKADKLVEAAKAQGITDADQLEAVRNYALSEAVTDWLYLVNDDDGMFESDTYTVTPDGSSSTYVEEYTVLARKLAAQGAGSYYNESADNFKEGIALSYTVEEGKTPTELLEQANGKTYSISSEVMKSTDENDEELSTTVYTLKTEEGNEISFIVNDYGIHVVFVKSLFLDDSQSSAITEIKDEDGEVKGYLVGPDYKYSTEVKVEYVKDENGDKTDEIKEITVEIKTVKEVLKESIKDGKISDNYNDEMNKFLQDYAEKCIEQNSKVYKKILKEVQ